MCKCVCVRLGVCIRTCILLHWVISQMCRKETYKYTYFTLEIFHPQSFNPDDIIQLKRYPSLSLEFIQVNTGDFFIYHVYFHHPCGYNEKYQI